MNKKSRVLLFLISLEFVKKYATKEAVDAAEEEESEDNMSSVESFTDDELNEL